MKLVTTSNLFYRVGVLFLLIATIASATPAVDDFGKALMAAADVQAELQGEARIEAFQKSFFQLSIDFPVLTDWVMQDGGKEAWQIILPEKRGEIIEQLFLAHGVKQADSLRAYARLCHLRRAERLAFAIKEWAPFVFTEGETIRNSFFGYTEGLSCLLYTSPSPRD